MDRLGITTGLRVSGDCINLFKHIILLYFNINKMFDHFENENKIKYGKLVIKE